MHEQCLMIWLLEEADVNMWHGLNAVVMVYAKGAVVSKN